MDIVEHERHEHSNHDHDYRGCDIGLIEEQDNSQDKEDNGHKTACKSVESVHDIDGIDDCNSNEEGQNRIEES